MQPAPPYQPSLGQRSKKSSPRKIVLIVLAILALLVGACSVWLFSITKPAVDEANRFLAAVDRGEYQAAADMTTCGGMNANRLEEIFAFQDIDYDLKSVEVSNGTNATVSGSINVPTESHRRITLSLFKVGDNWSVCRFSLN